MCVAMPGKIISVEGTKAIVDFSGNRIEAQAGLVKVKPGDSVLVHAGCILQILVQEDADSLSDLMEELQNI